MSHDYFASPYFRYFVSVINTPEGKTMTITDVYFGRALKIRQVEDYPYLSKLVMAVEENGFCYIDEKLCVAGIAYSVMMRLIEQPEEEESDKAYNAIMKFIEKGRIYLRE